MIMLGSDQERLWDRPVSAWNGEQVSASGFDPWNGCSRMIERYAEISRTGVCTLIC